jgi:hypothetical protein
MEKIDFNEMLKELSKKVTPEEMEDFKKDLQREMHQQTVQKLVDDYVVTYNLLIAQFGKLLSAFKQDRTEASVAAAIAAGMCIGSALGDDLDLVDRLCKMSRDIAMSICSDCKGDNELIAKRFGEIMATAQVLEGRTIMELVKKEGEFNPRDGEFAQEIGKFMKKTKITREE